MTKQHRIKAVQHVDLHFIDISGLGTISILEFSRTPVLLNKVELAVVFWVDITNVTTCLNIFLKLQLLGIEVRFCEKKPATTTVPHSHFTLEAFALSLHLPT